MQSQEQVDEEKQYLSEQGHTENMNDIIDVVFIQRVVLTVKKNRPVKIVLDARAANNSNAEVEYQMPNFEIQ